MAGYGLSYRAQLLNHFGTYVSNVFFFFNFFDTFFYFIDYFFPDDDDCETCPLILEKLETIDDDTDKHGIQFVKANDEKLAHEIGIFSFPALVYYETGVPIMYDGKFYNSFLLESL